MLLAQIYDKELFNIGTCIKQTDQYKIIKTSSYDTSGCYAAGACLYFDGDKFTTRSDGNLKEIGISFCSGEEDNLKSIITIINNI